MRRSNLCDYSAGYCVRGLISACFLAMCGVAFLSALLVFSLIGFDTLVMQAGFENTVRFVRESD